MCLRCKLVTIGHLWVIEEIYFRDICQHLQRKTPVLILSFKYRLSIPNKHVLERCFHPRIVLHTYYTSWKIYCQKYKNIDIKNISPNQLWFADRGNKCDCKGWCTNGQSDIIDTKLFHKYKCTNWCWAFSFWLVDESHHSKTIQHEQKLCFVLWIFWLRYESAYHLGS